MQPDFHTTISLANAWVGSRIPWSLKQKTHLHRLTSDRRNLSIFRCFVVVVIVSSCHGVIAVSAVEKDIAMAQFHRMDYHAL